MLPQFSNTFFYSMTKYAGACAAVLEGLDALLFIGENSAIVRAQLCRMLTRLGAELDEAANLSNNPRISARDSAVSVWVIPIKEEHMIAQHTLVTASK